MRLLVALGNEKDLSLTPLRKKYVLSPWPRLEHHPCDVIQRLLLPTTQNQASTLNVTPNENYALSMDLRILDGILRNMYLNLYCIKKYLLSPFIYF